jgi:hypothetical protein
MRLPYHPRPVERPRPQLVLDHIIVSGEAHLRRILISYGSRMSFSLRSADRIRSLFPAIRQWTEVGGSERRRAAFYRRGIDVTLA